MWTLVVCLLSFVTFDNTRKIRPKGFFFSGKGAFFSKFSVFKHLWGLEKRTYKFHSSCHKNLWILINCSLMFVTLGDTKENGPKTFVIVKTATFWKVCFYRPLRFQRNGLVICTIFCQNILWTVINCSLAFAILDNTRKTRPKFFFRWSFAFFSKLSVFNNLLWSWKKLI